MNITNFTKVIINEGFLINAVWDIIRHFYHLTFFSVCPLTHTGPGCTHCMPRLTGDDCGKCKLGFFGFPDCTGNNYQITNQA